MYYYFQFESNQILSHYGWYKSLIIYLTLLFDVSSRCRWWRWLDGLARFWVDGKIGGGWSGWDGWSGWSGYTRKRWTGCQQVGNKSVGGGRGGCRWGWSGGVNFQSSPGFNMTGFYWEIGWLHQTRIKSPGQGFWGVLEGVGTRYRVQTVDSLGYWGGWWWRWWLQWCWLLVGRGVVYRGGLQIKM